MWFVESLLIFSFFYVVVRKRCPAISKDCDSRPTLTGLFIAAIVMGIGSYFIRQVSPQDNWIGLSVWIFEPAHYLQYIMMFVLGILAYRFCWLDKMTNKTGLIALSIGALLAIGNYVRQDGAWNDFVWRWFVIWCPHTSRARHPPPSLLFLPYCLWLIGWVVISGRAPHGSVISSLRSFPLPLPPL